jgi:transposase, IS30 family
MVQGRPGRPPLAAKREQFARLIARGVASAEACRIVGVHPKTGKRWRLGRVMTSSSGARLHYAAVVSTGKQVISKRYLCEDERIRVADLRRFGSGVRVIAAQLGRSPSTVSRELRRNQDSGTGRYRPFAAPCPGRVEGEEHHQGIRHRINLFPGSVGGGRAASVP